MLTIQLFVVVVCLFMASVLRSASRPPEPNPTDAEVDAALASIEKSTVDNPQ